MSRTEVRLSGFGGQGIVLAGVLLARAAVLHDNRQATQTQSYGPESRGGACVSEVVFSDVPIDYPMAIAPDVLVVMSRDALARYGRTLRPGGILIIDDIVPDMPDRADCTIYRVPATRLAVEKLGRRIVANVVMLGILVGLTGVVSRKAIEQAVKESAPRGTEELNLRALREGFALAETLTPAVEVHA